jgi:hypothetical protein
MTVLSMALLFNSAISTFALSVGSPQRVPVTNTLSRRNVLASLAIGSVSASSILLTAPDKANADSAAIQDSLDVENFLRTGVDSGGGMGVSSQAGKSRPQTGVVFRDGSEVRQDGSGNVLAEILTGSKANPKAVLVSFATPWKLETGPVFDVECREARTGCALRSSLFSL